MKIIYIPRPHKMGSAREIFINIKGAERAAIRVWKAGFIALYPYMNSALFLMMMISVTFIFYFVVMDETEEFEKTKRELEFAIEHNILVLVKTNFNCLTLECK